MSPGHAAVSPLSIRKHDRPKLRIALNNLGGAQWTGGMTYRRNLVEALGAFQSEAEVFMVSSDEGEWADVSVIPQPDRGGFLTSSLDRVTRRFFQFDYKLSRAVARHQIDVLFPAGFSVGRKTANVYWIPDFQFVHLPHLYSPAQLHQFDVKLRKYFRSAALVVVSSKDAEEDLKKFLPEFHSKARVLSFVAHVPADLYDVDPVDVTRRWSLPPDFIYLPNQFWSHKNHDLVCEALRILKSRGVRPFIVCTGNPVDVRDPLHFARLLSQMSESGVRDQVALLGLVPHADVYSLIRQSKCVLNPSLFEGWSTSVEEAKSVGKRVLLSDLPVHFEQAPPGGVFFDRFDAGDLADKLESAWRDAEAGPDRELEHSARATLASRMDGFGRKFLDICRESIGIAR